MATSATRVEQVGGLPLPVQAEKIKEIRAEIRDLTVEVIRDKVIIQGIVHKQIFFVDINGIVRHIPEDVPFSTFIDVPGALPGMQAQVKVVIEHIKAELTANGREVIQKVILQIFVKVVDEVQFSVALNPAGPLVKAEEVVGENVRQELVVNEVELPVPAIKIDDIHAEIRITDTEVIRDKVIVQGIIHKQVFFVDANNVERHVAEDVPFSTFIDIPGARPGDNVQVNAVIELVKRELATIPGTLLRQEIVFEIFVKVHRTVQINIAIGSGPLIKIPFVIGENTKQDLIVNDILLEVPAIKVKEINASLRNLKTVVIRDKVVLQGILHKQIFYVDTNNIERHQAENIPFSNFIDIPGAEPEHQVDFNPVIEGVIFELRPGNILHQKAAIQYFIKVTEPQQVNITPGNGPLIKVEEVIGENTKQILVERRFPVRPPVIPIRVSRETIRVVTGAQQAVQKILNNCFVLPTQAVKVKSIIPTIRNVEIEVLTNQILVSGEIVKNVTFVDADNVVRNLTEVVPFEFLLEAPGIDPDFDVNDLRIEVENLSFRLSSDGCQVEQTIVLKFIISSEQAEQIQVVTDVVGPGITTQTVTANVELVIVPLTPAGQTPGLASFGPEPIERAVRLSPPAAEITDIIANIEDLTAAAEQGGVRFRGTIVKEVLYIDEQGQDQVETERIPFNLFYTNPAVRPNHLVPEAFVEINDIEIDLNPAGTILEQVVLLTFRFKVTDRRILSIVTNVSGPGIGQVTRETVLLDIVNDGRGPVPVQVVTNVQILST